MADPSLRSLNRRLHQTLAADTLIQDTTLRLRTELAVDRVVLYYFYRRWKGQVTFESLSDRSLSIYGSTGADDCFNDTYAALYLDGRIRAVSDIETELIHDCHRDFLRSIGVRANLVVPILPDRRLWGLLVAHHCHSPRYWTPEDIDAMSQGATTLATVAAVRNS